MIKKSFTKPPLSLGDKEKKAEEFISMMHSTKTHTIENSEKKEPQRITTKDSTTRFSLRLPSGLFENIKEISNITGLSINSICIEMLRVSAKQKLKELKE